MKIPPPRFYQGAGTWIDSTGRERLGGLALVRKAYLDGKRRILFWLATGGGKSVIFLLLGSGALNKGGRVVVVVKRKQLVFQAHRHFIKSGIDASIMIADHAGFDPAKKVQICSIDTVIRRDMEFLRDTDLMLIDEAHDATSPSYQEFLDECVKLNVKLFIGLTATPFSVGKKAHTFWDSCVKPIEMHELRDLGFLVDDDLYIPGDFDAKDVAVSRLTGDFNEKQLANKMTSLAYIGDAVKLYKERCPNGNRPGIFWGANVEHSKRQALEFQKAGIRAVHCDQGTPQKDRDRIIQELREGKIDIICNVNIFSTGVDIPEFEIGFPKPTLSENLYLQQVGRLLRPCRVCGKCKSQYDNSANCPVCGFDRPSYIKRKAVILDMGNNTERFGRIFNVRFPALEEEIAKQFGEKKEKSLIKTCQSCRYVYAIELQSCPQCGEGKTRERFVKTKKGELRPYDEYEAIKRTFTQLQRITLETNKKPNWKFFKLYEDYGDLIMKYQKEFEIPAWVPKIYKKSQEEKLSGKLYT